MNSTPSTGQMRRRPPPPASVRGVDPRDVLSRPAAGPDLVLRYADHADGLIDVFLAPSLGRPQVPAPLLVLVHGGFWRQEFDRTHLRPLATWLARDGFVVATPEYRRTGGAGRWPQTGDDVELALAVTPGLVDAAAPGHIDPTAPAVVAGHSAGGHLALWAGLRTGGHRVRSIVALAPVSDLVYAAETGMGDNAAQALLGGEPRDVPERYAETDLPRMLPSDVRVVIVQGTDDKQVTVSMNRTLASEHESDPNLTYMELSGVEHFALIDPLSQAFREVVLPALRT